MQQKRNFREKLSFVFLGSHTTGSPTGRIAIHRTIKVSLLFTNFLEKGPKILHQHCNKTGTSYRKQKKNLSNLSFSFKGLSIYNIIRQT